MKIIQIRDVPPDVHRRLKTRAAEQGRTLSELVREEAAGRPTMAELLERLARDEPADLPEPSAVAVRAGRDER